ncbi:MAG: hypothetical protein E7496_07450 [Ruminococcus sp.]|nr:hypothetical protein [Ruminococcus sp.]
MMLNGIDISYHNGSVGWEKIKNSGQVDFVILRAGFGKLISQKDKKFEENYSSAKSAGIPVGCYWYSYANSVPEIQTEAEVFLQAIKGKQFEYPVYLDFEEASQIALGREKCSEMAESFLDILEKAGYFAGLYSSKSHLENCFTETIRKRYAVWVAHYGVAKTNYSGRFGIWQKSESGSVPGISGKVDLNECYVDYPALIRNAGLNGFSKTVEIQKETIEITALKDGKIFSGILTEK